MGTPGGRIGLPNVTSGGPQQKSIKEMSHEGKPRHLGQGQLQALDPKGLSPTKPTQKNQGTAEAKGQPQTPGIQPTSHLQKLRRAMGPRVLTLLPTPHGIPCLGLPLSQKVDLSFIAEDRVENDRQQQSADCQANQLPECFFGIVHGREAIGTTPAPRRTECAHIPWSHLPAPPQGSIQ